MIASIITCLFLFLFTAQTAATIIKDRGDTAMHLPSIATRSPAAPATWLHVNWYFVLAAGVAVAVIMAAIVFVFACRRCRKAKQPDIEESRFPKAIPSKLFKLSSDPQPCPIQAPAPAAHPFASNRTAPPEPPLEWDIPYSFRDCMKTYGEQHQEDQSFDKHFLPSLSTSPERRKATEDLIKERMRMRESMGLPYNRPTMALR